MGNVESADPEAAGPEPGQLEVQPAAVEHRPADPTSLAHDEIVDYAALRGGSLTVCVYIVWN